MYRVLIVDDETIALRYLSTLIDWEAEGFDLPATAMTISRALDIFNSQRFDIILTDVRMPEMDGVSLVSLLRKTNPDCKGIILTAYRDFEVVQRSVQIGVSGFLLKHELDAEMLTKVLHETVIKLENERRLRRAALSHWLGERFFRGKALPGPERTLSEDQYYQILFLKNRQWEFLDETRSPEEPINQKDYPILAETVLGSVHCRIQAVSLKEAGEQVPAGQNTESQIILFSELYHSLTDVPDSRIVHHLEETVTLNSPLSMSVAQYIAIESASLTFPQDYTARGTEYLRTRNEALIEWTIHPLQGLTQQKKCRIADLRPLCSLLSRCRNINRENEESRTDQLLTGFADCAGISDVIDKITRDLSAMLERAGSGRDIGSEYARRAADILRREYGRDLHTSDLAGRLYISEGYLRSVFKKTYGCTISEYLRKTRMDMACSLLKSRKYRVYEIADLCGFANSQHFNQVFRQEKGMSPLRYAQLCEEEPGQNL